MQSWAYHTGKLDADGNPLDYEDEGADSKDKYWQKYMTEDSPYRAKYSPPIKIKSPQRPQSGNPFPKFLGKKKKPKWMTNEQYERLTLRWLFRNRLQDNAYGLIEGLYVGGVDWIESFFVFLNRFGSCVDANVGRVMWDVTKVWLFRLCLDK